FLVTVPCTVLTIAFTDSRGGFLALVMTTFALVMMSRQKVLAFCLSPGVIAVFFMIVPQSYIDRLKTIREHSDASSQGRLKAWANGMRMIADRPFTGVGYRKLHLVYYFYTPDRTEQRRVAHNSYIQITAESGIPALVVFLSLIGY